MIEEDTIRLLRECDAGVQMGVASIADVVEHAKSDGLRRCLADCREKHEALGREIQALLERYHDEGKAPSPMAKGMSRMKTGVKLGMDDSDQTIADLMTDGCDMGTKSLHKYLNQYAAAAEQAKDLAKRLIQLEEQLRIALRDYL